MLPYITLFKRIPTYSLAAIVWVTFSIIYLKLVLKKSKDIEVDAELAFVYGVVGAFIGAKLLSLLTMLPEFLAELKYLFSAPDLFLKKYLYGGFVFYGGLYGAIFAVLIYCRICKVSFSKIASILLPVVTLIHGFGRIGCFCMGCCYGKLSHKFGIEFAASEIAPNGVPLIPVQLIEAVFVFLLFGILLLRVINDMDGVNSLGIYFLVYGVVRFILEFWRGDNYRGFIGVLSVSQVISILTVMIGLTLLGYKHHQRNRQVVTKDHKKKAAMRIQR